MTPRPSAIAAVAALLVLSLAGCTSELSAAPAPTIAPVESSSPTPDPTPTPIPVEATCENTSTAEFQSMMAEDEWVSWSRPDGSGWPFGDFPGGAPAGNLACTWGEDPDVGTDNIITMAWAPITAEAAAAAQDQLEAAGHERIESPEGVYLASTDTGEWADDEGYGATYLFTDDDVRWAMFKDEIAFVKAPDEAG